MNGGVSASKVMTAVIAFLVAGLLANSAAGGEKNTQLKGWRSIPVLEGGRQKPLDTLAWESLRDLTGRTSFPDPDTGEQLDSTAWYVAMLLGWEGWNQMPAPPQNVDYYSMHKPDKWDKAAMLRVKNRTLRELLGMTPAEKYISPLNLAQTRVRDPETEKELLFDEWVQAIYDNHVEGEYNSLQEAAFKLWNQLLSFQSHRMGEQVAIIPLKNDEDRRWISLAILMQAELDDTIDPTGGLQRIQAEFRKAREAYFGENRDQAFPKATESLVATLHDCGPRLGEYPEAGALDLEVTYNRWWPMGFAWAFALIASVMLLASAIIRLKERELYILGAVFLGFSLVAMTVGLGMRSMITDRAPVTNLYESVVFTGFGTAVLGLALGLGIKKKGILAASAIVTTIILVIADFFPGVLDPGLRPLMPVLRSNFWLAVHVMTIMLSYSGFALAVGIGNVTLGFYLFGRQKGDEAIRVQSRLTYKSLEAGVLLLILGTFLGAAWADYSWGRFWGWDPKEVWALITLLGYLAIMHARRVGWIGSLGLAGWSVVCFTLVLMAWYGVNFLSGGLHNYGLAGADGPAYVIGVITLQVTFVIAATIRGVLSTPKIQRTGPAGGL